MGIAHPVGGHPKDTDHLMIPEHEHTQRESRVNRQTDKCTDTVDIDWEIWDIGSLIHELQDTASSACVIIHLLDTNEITEIKIYIESLPWQTWAFQCFCHMVLHHVRNITTGGVILQSHSWILLVWRIMLIEGWVKKRKEMYSQRGSQDWSQSLKILWQSIFSM